jgi:hypothetical protein
MSILLHRRQRSIGAGSMLPSRAKCLASASPAKRPTSLKAPHFGVWRNKLAALKLHIRGLRVGDQEIERLTNVGQALIAWQLLELAMTRRALSQLIIEVTGADQGYSDSNDGRWWPTVRGIVAEAGVAFAM